MQLSSRRVKYEAYVAIIPVDSPKILASDPGLDLGSFPSTGEPLAALGFGGLLVTPPLPEAAELCFAPIEAPIDSAAVPRASS